MAGARKSVTNGRFRYSGRPCPPGEGRTETALEVCLAVNSPPLEARWRSVGPCRMPQRQHAVEAEPIDRLCHARLLDLPRERTQTKRIEGNGCRRSQERQVAKARR